MYFFSLSGWQGGTVQRGPRAPRGGGFLFLSEADDWGRVAFPFGTIGRVEWLAIWHKCIGWDLELHSLGMYSLKLDDRNLATIVRINNLPLALVPENRNGDLSLVKLAYASGSRLCDYNLP